MKYVGVKSKWITVLNVKYKSIKLLEENICDLGLGEYNLKSRLIKNNKNYNKLYFKIKKRTLRA